MNIPNDGGWGKDIGRNASLDRFSALSRDWMLLGSAALMATLCFGLGLLAARENQPSKDPLWIEQLPPEELPGSISTSTAAGQGISATSSTATQQITPSLPAAAAAAASSPPAQTGNYVASKTGTRYYLPSCATAKRIKDENKVWFATKQEAQAAGYQPSTTCKGL